MVSDFFEFQWTKENRSEVKTNKEWIIEREIWEENLNWLISFESKFFVKFVWNSWRGRKKIFYEPRDIRWWFERFCKVWWSSDPSFRCAEKKSVKKIWSIEINQNEPLPSRYCKKLCDLCCPEEFEHRDPEKVVRHRSPLKYFSIDFFVKEKEKRTNSTPIDPFASLSENERIVVLRQALIITVRTKHRLK